MLVEHWLKHLEEARMTADDVHAQLVETSFQHAGAFLQRVLEASEQCRHVDDQ